MNSLLRNSCLVCRRTVGRRGIIAIAAVVAASGSSARAQVTAPSIYTTAIHVQGEVAGTEFDDWAASGIPIATSDLQDQFPGLLDISDVQVANDEDFIYIRATLYNTDPSSNLSALYLAFDTDRNKATGFDIGPFGIIGSEIGYQADYPFAQAAGQFNRNVSLLGGPYNNGGALIFPFWNFPTPPMGTQLEWAVPLDASIVFPAAQAFPTETFDFLVYTNDGAIDVTDVITYTLATAPVVTPGDYNGDLKVDAADYTIWRDTLGSNDDLRANGDNTGESANVIDQADYAVWKANFGTGGGSGSLASVPEPTSVALVLLGAVALGLVRKRN